MNGRSNKFKAWLKDKDTSKVACIPMAFTHNPRVWRLKSPAQGVQAWEDCAPYDRGPVHEAFSLIPCAARSTLGA